MPPEGVVKFLSKPRFNPPFADQRAFFNQALCHEGAHQHSGTVMSAATIALQRETPHASANAQSSAQPVRSALSALAALCALARFHQVAADPATLAHQLGLTNNQALTVDDLLLAAKHLGLKAKRSRSSIDRLGLLPLPALALMRIQDDTQGATENTGLHVVILAQSDGQRVLYQDVSGSSSGAQLLLPPRSSLPQTSAKLGAASSSSLPAAPVWPEHWPSLTSPGSYLAW